MSNPDSRSITAPAGRFITFSAAELTPLSTEEDHCRGVWQVDGPIQVSLLGMPWLTIPAGFQTDGSSIPPWALWCFDEWGRDGLPGVLHDYLLTTALPKWICDLVFLAALRSQGATELSATLMYFAVRTRPK
jgi:hypothetical protein